MQYTILSKRSSGDTLFTEVKFDFDDTTSVTVSIPHFQPADRAEVLRGIRNRAMSEHRANEAAKRLVVIGAAMTADVGSPTTTPSA